MFSARASMLLRRLLVSFASITIGAELSEAATFINAVPPDSWIPSVADRSDPSYHKSYIKWEIYVVLVLGISILLLVILFLYTNNVRSTKDKEILKKLTQSPPVEAVEEVIVNIPEETRSELVFFVEREEWFELDELLDGAADLRTQGFCSSLYMVQLKNNNNSVFAVKRLKKLKASFEEFGFTMKRIGNLRHPNILPLVGYNSTPEEKLLIYRYQQNGSLLSLLESKFGNRYSESKLLERRHLIFIGVLNIDIVADYIEGKRAFPWKHRLSIAVGIARGLNFIYQNRDEDIIPHGNLKLSNIMLENNEEPLISEYGYAKFIDQSRSTCLFYNGYAAPEKMLTEQADVYSFGVILLELLTGKNVEKSGLDLPKWVRAMVREEWTGEVFDKDVVKVQMYAFPLLNISLKCVEIEPEGRPRIAEVLEKIEELFNDQECIVFPISEASF